MFDSYRPDDRPADDGRRDIRRRGWVNEPLVSLPTRQVSPPRQLAARALIAVGLLALIVVIVYVDRDAYRDSYDGSVSLIDSIYYATVTITTTGYGDITPVLPHARIINAIVITPLRIAFLVLLVGTTLEVLATQGRRIFLDSRWRKRMRNHVVVVGYGTKGHSAVQTLIDTKYTAEQVVIIDGRPGVVSEANLEGFAAIAGDATRREILRRAEISRAADVIITLDRDDSAILVTLTVRQLNPAAHIVVAVRERDNASLLRQSGANAVITSSEAVGRVVGLSSISPNIGEVIEDLLTADEGLEIVERQISADEVGHDPSEIRPERVLGVVRNKTLRPYDDPTVASLDTGDRIVVVRRGSRTDGGRISGGGPAN
ncbi:NAD-binding protein of Kef-type K+ transporter [Microlunatus endophyticus]|uniref:NAD-binding protein of Kef-type K+ transporter n=1 Tax=Microlunatus endophyticus TaxID=1716077 RepID=A0A917S245_9ACTN|nr:potassium channel family protein [Microlunatus endophyticus]GGL53500.1 NAD-binding protein of Kef-type K+ transporter [Microlunatus endophyticus]